MYMFRKALIQREKTGSTIRVATCGQQRRQAHRTTALPGSLTREGRRRRDRANHRLAIRRREKGARFRRLGQYDPLKNT